MFFRGSSGSGSTGVVTLYMTKLSREVRRNCGSGPSQRWSIFILFLFFYIFIVFMQWLEQRVSLGQTKKKKKRREKAVWDQRQFRKCRPYPLLPLSPKFLSLFLFTLHLCTEPLWVLHQPPLSQPPNLLANTTQLAFSGIPQILLSF